MWRLDRQAGQIAIHGFCDTVLQCIDQWVTLLEEIAQGLRAAAQSLVDGSLAGAVQRAQFARQGGVEAADISPPGGRWQVDDVHKTVHIAHGLGLDLGLRRVTTQPPGQQPLGLGLLVLRGQDAGRLRPACLSAASKSASPWLQRRRARSTSANACAASRCSACR